MHYLMEYIYLYNLSDGKTNQSYMYKLVRTFCQNYNFKFTETLDKICFICLMAIKS